MKLYRVSRAIFAESIEDIDFENIGINWAIDANAADDFALQFKGSRGKYFVFEAIVNESQIDIAQTNGQWNSEHSYENEVVLKEYEDIEVFLMDDEMLLPTGEKYSANTGVAKFDETRPDPIPCDEDEILEQLEKTSK